MAHSTAPTAPAHLTWQDLRKDRLFATTPDGARKSPAYQAILSTHDYNQGSSGVKQKIGVGVIFAIVGVVLSIFASDPLWQDLVGPVMDLAALGLFCSACQEFRARKLVAQDQENGHTTLKALYIQAQKELQEGVTRRNWTAGMTRGYEGPLGVAGRLHVTGIRLPS